MSDNAGDLKSFDCWAAEDSDPDGPVDEPTPYAKAVQRLDGLNHARAAAEAYAELLFYGNAEPETDAEDGEDTYDVHVRDPTGKVTSFTVDVEAEYHFSAFTRDDVNEADAKAEAADV